MGKWDARRTSYVCSFGYEEVTQVQQEDEQAMGVNPKYVHRGNELPSALRVDKTKQVNAEAIRSQQAQEFVINPGRQKR